MSNVPKTSQSENNGYLAWVRAVDCPLSPNLQKPGLPEQAVEAGLNLTAAVITGN